MKGLRCVGAAVYEYYGAWKLHSVVFVGDALSESWAYKWKGAAVNE